MQWTGYPFKIRRYLGPWNRLLPGLYAHQGTDYLNFSWWGKKRFIVWLQYTKNILQVRLNKHDIERTKTRSNKKHRANRTSSSWLTFNISMCNIGLQNSSQTEIATFGNLKNYLATYKFLRELRESYPNDEKRGELENR